MRLHISPRLKSASPVTRATVQFHPLTPSATQELRSFPGMLTCQLCPPQQPGDQAQHTWQPLAPHPLALHQLLARPELRLRLCRYFNATLCLLDPNLLQCCLPQCCPLHCVMCVLHSWAKLDAQLVLHLRQSRSSKHIKKGCTDAILDSHYLCNMLLPDRVQHWQKWVSLLSWTFSSGQAAVSSARASILMRVADSAGAC